MPFTILYVTHPSIEAAKTCAADLLDQKLIACANFFAIENMYQWKGERVSENEVVSILKTTNEKVDAAEKAILAMHSYEVPCVMRLPVSANTSYEQWIAGEVK